MTGFLRLLRHGAVALAALAAIVAPGWFLITALGAKFDFWPPLTAFRHVFAHLRDVLIATLAIGIAAFILVVVTRIFFYPAIRSGSGGWVASLAAIAIGAGGLAYAASVRETAQSVPPIHDITTDPEDPPQFSRAMIERRARTEDVNPVDYAAKTHPRTGEPLPAVQAEAYPEIDTIRLDADPGSAYRAALDVARNMGWRVTSASPDSLMFEGTAETFWFGFKDDVVVRVRPVEEGEGAEVDIRSVSRVGTSDLGANAARIREFAERLRRSVGEPETG